MPRAMSERRTSLLGALLVAIAPLSMALYTPALPTLVAVFETTPSVVNATLLVYFAGFAVTQLVCGPLSDAYGRKPVTLAFLGLHVVGSIIAVLAPDIEWLIAARLVQGIGASVGVAASRAIVRDQYTGETSSRIMNAIGIMLAIAPAIAPTLGGLTLSLANWHAIFVIMLFAGLALVGIVLVFMRETTVGDPRLAHPANLVRSYVRLFTSLTFITSVLTVAGSVGALYTLATVLPYLLIERAGLTPAQFGMGMLAQSGSFLVGSLVMRAAMNRASAFRLVPVGLGFIAAGSALMAISIAVLPISFLSIMAPVGVYAFGIAFVMPAMTTASLAPFPGIAGAAAAAMGFIQIGAGLVGGLVATAIGDPVLGTQIVIPALGTTAVVAYTIFRLRTPALAPQRVVDDHPPLRGIE